VRGWPRIPALRRDLTDPISRRELGLCAREHDVGTDREPEGVVADDRNLDEHAEDGNDHRQQREHKPEVHCAYLLALRRNS